jgi:hypothetical protein
MQVELRPISSIRPYESNPRINDAAVDAVAASIKEFGFRQPIVVDEQGVIIVGHTRYKAALKLGLETVPVHVAVGLTPAAFRAWKWLTGMLRRRQRGEAPVSMREFDELATWFERNAERMPLNGCVDLGNGRRVDQANLRYSIQKGVTDVHVGELVASLRRLREVMGDASPRTDAF